MQDDLRKSDSCHQVSERKKVVTSSNDSLACALIDLGAFGSMGVHLPSEKPILPYFSSLSMVAVSVPFPEVRSRKGTESGLGWPPLVAQHLCWSSLKQMTEKYSRAMCYQCLIAPVGTLWDSQGWSPRTLPAFPHFNTSLTNELMDFCRSIWWICAGGSPDFLTDRCPELVYGSGIHAPKPKPRRFSPRPKHDLRLLEHLVSAFHMIHPKYALLSVDGLFSYRPHVRWLWPF